MAALLGSGALDRYPRLRVGVLEAGHGWLPSWLKRLDEHVHSTGYWLPERWVLDQVNDGLYQWRRAPMQFVPTGSR